MERSLYPNLKLTMYRTGIRQNMLAKSVGINEAYLSRIINGTRHPGPQVQVQIAQVLRENVDWLFQKSKMAEETPLLTESKSKALGAA